ncbi:autophagy-related protein 13-domain-containing protein [Morchella snyderi]|nr:autophagy-related protein 13-domain-containing protein [Morchella snyderi]
MYGHESPTPWSTPPRRRTAAGTTTNDDPDSSSTRRFSAGFTYAGMDGSGSTSSGGFTNIASGGATGGHTRSGSHGGYSSNVPGGTGGGGAPAERTSRDKANQIVQAYFGKAAMVILHARVVLPPTFSPKSGQKKVNRWFNIELDETDEFREILELWRKGDCFEPRPPPMIIETYLDATDLTANQSLVILDGEGKRWNVNEALDTAAVVAGVNNTESRKAGRGGGSRHEVILERWTVDLSPPYDIALAPELPVVYKKGIILFRALYAYAGLMPTWKFRRRLSKVKLNTSTLKVNCRIINGSNYTRAPKEWDLLQVPLYEGDKEVTDTYSFPRVESPAGCFDISVEFRKNCEFRVDDSEALLSSHFINLDEHYFRPSLTQKAPSQQPLGYASVGKEMNSLPSANTHPPPRPDYNQTYGSLSSFHHQGTVPSGASPISALRTAAELADRASLNSSPIERPPTGLRSIQCSKSSLRSFEGVQRRPSVSFMQPFKSPSLSASPANSDQVASSPRTSLSRITTPVAPSHRQRPSLGTMSPTFRNSPGLPDGTSNQTPVPVSSFPGSSPLAQGQPITRITSSFGQRRPRIISGASRTDDDNTSSGKASYSSSAAPGSGLYLDAGANSTMDEDLQIRDFMSMLADGQRQTLKSFQASGIAGEGSSKRAGNALSKFQKMRDSQSALAESMSSSLLLQPSLGSPSTSSRQLTNAPVMVTSTALSSSSSPGKPVSPHTPHTPHTPAIPSRLSEGLTAQYDQRRHRSPHPPRGGQQNDRESAIGERQEIDQEMTMASKTSPLDIPNSPRPFPRRSNSMSQPPEDGGASLDFDPTVAYGPNQRQSASLGSVNMVPLSLSRLLDLQDASGAGISDREDSGELRGGGGDDILAFGPPGPPSIDSVEGERPRFQQRYTRGSTPSGPGSSGQTSRSRLSRGQPSAGSSSLISERINSEAPINRMNGPSSIERRTPSYNQDDELLFDMSDMTGTHQSTRRSLEQGSGGRDVSASSPGRRGSRGGLGGSGGIGRGDWS